MKLKKSLVAGAMCMATALCPLANSIPSVNATSELADSIANDSGLYYDFARALQYSIYFYDANMCGTEVEENNLYLWRGNCHTYDAEVPLKPMPDKKSSGTNLSQEFIDKYKNILDPDGDGLIDVSGGFHDAGDHVKFGMPENYSASTIGWGYYEFRDSYIKTGQQEHIETVLRCFNDYLMKCTFRDNEGTVIAHCYQVGDGDIDHAYWNSPEVDSMVRPAFFLTADKPQTDYVASAAASLAINYLNFKDTDPEYAEKSLDYAKALFKFAMDNPKELSDNEDGPKSYYRSSKWEDDYCWAAAWLYKITGEHKYLEEIYPNYDYYAAPCYVHCWNDVWGGVQCILGEICMEKPLKDGEYVYPDFIDEFKETAGKSPYEQMNCWQSVSKAIETYMSGGLGTVTPAGYWWLDTWGSARYNTAGQLMALVHDKYVNDGKAGKYSEWAKGQMEYIMGNNPLKRSYIVGYNENSVKYPHHRACSGLTKCEDPDEHRYVLYGALAGGPDDKDKHNDTTADWVYNEVTIDYNAAFVGACDPLTGAVTRWVANEDGGYWDYCDFPLAEADDEIIANWPVPDPDDFDYDELLDRCKLYRHKAVHFGHPGVSDVMNNTGMIRGMENIYMDLALETESVMTLLDRRMKAELAMFERALDKCRDYVDFIWTGEDLGTQRAPLISLDMFRAQIRPRHQPLVDLASSYGKPVMIHCCGSSSWAFEDFIEMGIRAVDTLQPEAADMDPACLARKYGGRLAFHGCISTAKLAVMTPEAVVQNVAETLETMMPHHGYCLAPTHYLQDNTPVENVIAMYRTAHRLGRY